CSGLAAVITAEAERAMYCAIKPITTVCSKRSGGGEALLSTPRHGISLMTGGGRDKRVTG
ncbi:TPA: hypothetical protein ACQQIZ_006528, partial [Pseudomonas aeruginosa]